MGIASIFYNMSEFRLVELKQHIEEELIRAIIQSQGMDEKISSDILYKGVAFIATIEEQIAEDKDEEIDLINGRELHDLFVKIWWKVHHDEFPDKFPMDYDEKDRLWYEDMMIDIEAEHMCMTKKFAKTFMVALADANLTAAKQRAQIYAEMREEA